MIPMLLLTVQASASSFTSQTLPHASLPLLVVRPLGSACRQSKRAQPRDNATTVATLGRRPQQQSAAGSTRPAIQIGTRGFAHRPLWLRRLPSPTANTRHLPDDHRCRPPEVDRAPPSSRSQALPPGGGATPGAATARPPTAGHPRETPSGHALSLHHQETVAGAAAKMQTSSSRRRERLPPHHPPPSQRKERMRRLRHWCSSRSLRTGGSPLGAQGGQARGRDGCETTARAPQRRHVCGGRQRSNDAVKELVGEAPQQVHRRGKAGGGARVSARRDGRRRRGRQRPRRMRAAGYGRHREPGDKGVGEGGGRRGAGAQQTANSTWMADRVGVVEWEARGGTSGP